MEKAGEFLGRVVRRINRSEAPLAWLVAAWQAVVGKAVAAHTRPVRCQDGRLELAVDAKDWQRELEPLERVIRDRINRAWGGSLVREVKFVAAKPGPMRLPREIDNDHVPFIRRRK